MQTLDHGKALVLFSGGQDSSIALALALDRFQSVATIGFDYGQRHAVELAQRAEVRARIAEAFPLWADKLDDDLLVDLAALGSLSETALTREAEIRLAENGLPTTFVPARNLVFLTLAAAHAYRIGAGVLVAGMCEADYSGYPDCRRAAIDAQEAALRLGMDADIRIETPLMRATKAESWRMAERAGGERLVALIVEHSHTCYRGERGARHDWGYGCGACPACALRAQGYAEYRSGP